MGRERHHCQPQRRVLLYCAWAALCCGCTFDGGGLLEPRSLNTDAGTATHFPDSWSGIDQDHPADAATNVSRDLAAPTKDGSPTDASRDTPAAQLVDADGADDSRPDGALTDATHDNDASPTVVPLTATLIGEAFDRRTVDCPSADDWSAVVATPIVDDPHVTLLPGEIPLAAAPQSVAEWVGGLPSVVLIWDPNGCEDDSWNSAGFLIRGAQLDAEGRLVLAPTTTPTDLNLLNVSSEGAYQREWAGTPDEILDSHWLALSVRAAKKIVLRLALPGQ